jgi:DNA topoisomerase I
VRGTLATLDDPHPEEPAQRASRRTHHRSACFETRPLGAPQHEDPGWAASPPSARRNGTRPAARAFDPRADRDSIVSRIQRISSGEPVAAPPDIAKLIYVTGEEPGIRRRRAGKGFSYIGADGRAIRDAATLARIRALAIPPAYEDVWIAADPNAHIQATGRDQKGRKQYRYHADWMTSRAANKFERLADFAEALPALRQRVKADMALPGLPRPKVLATVVSLLETTLIRVGNEDYAKTNKSYGLTTLRRRHVKVEGSELRFDFKGKSGKTWRVSVRDRRIARILRACQELPGQSLFRYHDADGEPQAVTSADVNDYLREVTGEEITAKDFRTWAGTVLAAAAFAELPAPETKRASQAAVKEVIHKVAQRLGNTPTVCRASYVHPEVLNGFIEARFLWPPDSKAIRAAVEKGLRIEEARTLAMLRKIAKVNGAG